MAKHSKAQEFFFFQQRVLLSCLSPRSNVSFLDCTEIHSLILSSDIFGLGTAKDKLTYHNGRKFSTKDQDNDLSSVNCATVPDIQGAWWYGDCKNSNLNGVYRNGVNNGTIVWGGVPHIKRAEMKIIPKDI